MTALVVVRKVAFDMGEPEAGTVELAALADAAREVAEHDFARLVLEARVADVPLDCSGPACRARGAALADLAERVAQDGDFARAEVLFSEAVKLAPDSVSVRAKRAWFFAERGRWSDAFSAAFMGAGQSVSMTYTMVRSETARARYGNAAGDGGGDAGGDAIIYADRLGRKAPELGLVAAAVQRLAGVHKALVEVGPNGSEATARLLLRRIRALVEVGLETIAITELPGLSAFPALLRDAAWAIASPPRARPPGADLFPLADRLRAARIAVEAGTPERRRRFEVLARRQDLRALTSAPATPGPATAIMAARLELARALLAEGDFHEAWALVRTDGSKAAVELIKSASEGVRADLRLDHARKARERGDATPQRTLADEARSAFKTIGARAHMLDAALLACEALVTLGLTKDAYDAALAGLIAAREDGNPERIRAFEALLARLGDLRRNSANGVNHEHERRLGEPRPATYEDTLRAHLRECDALDDDRCLARSEEALGFVAIQRGRVTEARTALDKAVAGFTLQHDGPRARRATMAIARVHRLRSELALAAGKAEEVLAAAVDDGDGAAEREALHELGSLALAQGDLAAARTWLAAARGRPCAATTSSPSRARTPTSGAPSCCWVASSRARRACSSARSPASRDSAPPATPSAPASISPRPC